MHVAIDARLARYTPGGIAQYALALARALPGVAAPGDLFTVLHSARGRAPLPPERARRSAPLFTPPHHRLEQLALPVEVARIRPDVLHSPDFIPPFVRPFRSVVTVHDLGFMKYPETLTEESRRYYGRVGRAVRSAERTIAVSHATARDLAELLDAPMDRVRVVHNGVDPLFHAPVAPADVERACARAGLDRPYVAFLGTLEPRKNVPTLLRAFGMVRDRHDVLLALIGRRGWLYEPILALIDELGLRDAVRSIEDAPRADFPALLRGATAFAFPSLYEGFGLPPLEAMAVGTPTVVAATSSLPEVVGDAALLHPPTDHEALADALLRLIEDDALRATLSERGRARAAQFSWERAARETLAVYREAMATRR